MTCIEGTDFMSLPVNEQNHIICPNFHPAVKVGKMSKSGTYLSPSV